MSSTIQLNVYRGVATVMDTGLNALGASTGKAISAALDNTSDGAAAGGDLFDDLDLSVNFVSAPTVGTVIELYLLPSLDGGTTYADGSASVEPQSSLFVGGFAVRADTAVQRLFVRGVPLPPGFFKYLLRNTTNQAFPASGSVLRRNPYYLQSV